MSASAPAVSVAMITYNHERFVGAATRSVLEQTFPDLELIVVDDGSTDGTAAAIASFSDPRLVSIRQENAGPSVALNTALAAARGQYVALMSGDDVCHRDRLAKQLAEYQRGPRRVLFSGVDLIDEDGARFPSGHQAETLFDTTPHSQAQVLTRFFHRGNFLNAVTFFTERAVLPPQRPFDPVLFQLQDFDLWLYLVKRYPLFVMPEPLVDYRIRSNNQNLSSHTPEHLIRGDNEYYFILRRFFDDVPADLFHAAFGAELLRPTCSSPVAMACEQAFLFLRSSRAAQQLIGLERLHDLVAEPEAAQVLRDDYDFTHLHLVRLLRDRDLFGLFGSQTTTLYVDTGSGFNEDQVCRQTTFPLRSAFALTFDLSAFAAVRQLRWDPIEMRHCRIWLEEVCWHGRSGQSGALTGAGLVSNGVREADGSYSFETPDPLFLFPLTGEVTELSLRGRWEVLDHRTSFARTQAQLDAARQRLAHRDREVQSLQARLRGMEQSTTWRMLRPARAVMDRVKRVLAR